MSSNSERSADLAAERHYVAGLYSMLDAKRAEAEALVDVELRRGADSGLWQRDVAVAHWSRRSAQFGAVENGLCFGAMHSSDGIRSYIGRIGLFDDAVKEPLLIDWRAPAARPFLLRDRRTAGGYGTQAPFPHQRTYVTRFSR